jgi:hypothetical protein
MAIGHGAFRFNTSLINRWVVLKVNLVIALAIACVSVFQAAHIGVHFNHYYYYYYMFKMTLKNCNILQTLGWDVGIYVSVLTSNIRTISQFNGMSTSELCNDLLPE